MNIGKVIEQLQRYDPKTPCAWDLWLPDDVEEMAEQMDVELTEDEVRDVLYHMEKGKDATIGLTWTTVEANIDWVVSERKAREAKS